MTAAPALTPGLSSPSSARPSGGGTAGRRDASFGDALDRESKGASDPAAGSRGQGPSDDKQQGVAGIETTVSGQETGSAAGVPRAQPPRGAAPSPGADARDAASVLAQRLQAALSQADATSQAGAPQDRGPWLPGMVDDNGEMFDAARLLAIMRSEGAQAATSAAGATVVTVLGQERHLALGRMSPELAGALAQDPDLAAAVRGEAKAATNAAALPSQADMPADGLERTRGKAEGDEMGRFASEAGAGRRGSLFAAEGRGQSGAGLGDQRQEGPQKDGRSPGNGGQPTSGAFASAMQGAGLQASNAGRVVPGTTGVQHDPLSDQIAGRIRAELTAGGAGESSSEGVVKVLSLELKPANLGAVTVRMSLKDNVISLHVETQHAETRALIEREQARLTSALSAAGYSVETITAVQSDGVRLGGVVAPGDSSSTAFQEPGNQNQGGSDFSGDERSGRPSAGGDRDRSTSGGNDDTGATARRGVDGVYV